MSALDPEGWVANPPSTLVKVQGVASRESLNGSLGIVLHYDTDRARYVVLMTVSQTQMSLKRENLAKASWLEQMMGQYQLVRYHPNVRRHAETIYRNVQMRTGIKPEYVGIGAAVLLAIVTYLVGFTRMLMMMSFALLLLMIMAQDLLAGADRATLLRNFPHRCREMIRESIPVVGPRIADSPYMSAAVMGLLFVFFLRSMISRQSSVPSALYGSKNKSSTARTLQDDENFKEFYYKLGFDDATALKPFGTSLSAAEPSEPLDDWDLSSSTASSQPRQTSWYNHFGTLMSMFYLSRTVMAKGRDPGTGQFDIQLLKQNISRMEPMEMFFVGMAVYRLVSLLKS